MNVEADAVLLDLESPAGLRPYRHLPATRPLSAACVSPEEGQSHVPIHIKWCMRIHAARTSGFWSTRRGLEGGARRRTNGGGASDIRHHDERLLWVVCCVLGVVCCVLCAVAGANLVVRQEAYEVLEHNFRILRYYGAQLFTTATARAPPRTNTHCVQG